MFNNNKSKIRVNEFKKKYKKFLEAMQYINDNRKGLEKDPKKFEILKQNFKTKFEEPLDVAWLELFPDEKHKFNTLYALNRWKPEEDMEEINRLAKIVNGTIINVKEGKEK